MIRFKFPQREMTDRILTKCKHNHLTNRSQIAKRRYGEHESEIMSDHYSISKSHNKRSKNIITLNTGMKQPSQTYSRLGESAHKSEYSCGASETKRRKYADEGDYEDQNYNGKA